MLSLTCLKLLMQVLSTFLVVGFWILLIYLVVCISFKVNYLPEITAVRVFILGYIAYGLRFVFIVVTELQSKLMQNEIRGRIDWVSQIVQSSWAVIKNWNVFFRLSVIILLGAAVVPFVAQLVFKACMNGRGPYPECDRPDSWIVSQFSLPFYGHVITSLVDDHFKKDKDVAN